MLFDLYHDCFIPERSSDCLSSSSLANEVECVGVQFASDFYLQVLKFAVGCQVFHSDPHFGLNVALVYLRTVFREYLYSHEMFRTSHVFFQCFLLPFYYDIHLIAIRRNVSVHVDNTVAEKTHGHVCMVLALRPG